jgi:hypothetical protein
MADKKKVATKAKAPKKAPKERILGVAVAGTTKGNILKELSDGKAHKIEDLKECRVNADDSIGWRLSMLKDAGKHANPPYKLEIDDTIVKLIPTGKAVSGNGSSKANGKEKPAAKAKPKAEAKEKAEAKAPAAVAKASVQDVPADEEE